MEGTRKNIRVLGVMTRTRVVHCKKEPYDVYIGRPSMWGNPFSHKKGTLAEYMVDSVEEAIAAYEIWIKMQPALMSSIETLRGKTLGCWCKPKQCHGDVIIKLLGENND